MSMKYLGEQFDIHVGGEDLRSTHHPNEIAQSEGATGKEPFVKTWVHGAFLLVDGGRMGKSLGNAYTVQDVVGKGYDPLALRYFYLTGHYRKQLNFTWEALAGAAAALARLRAAYQAAASSQGDRTQLSEEKLSKVSEYTEAFAAELADDLNMPAALAVVWEAVKSNIPNYDKVDLLNDFDRVLGLGLSTYQQKQDELPPEIQTLLVKRRELRAAKNYAEADKIRDEILAKGYQVKDEVA